MTKQKRIEQDQQIAKKIFGDLVEDVLSKKDPYQKFDRGMLAEYRNSLISLYPYRKEIVEHSLRCEEQATLKVGSKLGEDITVEFGYLLFATQRDKILFKCSPDYKIIHIKTAKDWLDFKNKKEDI